MAIGIFFYVAIIILLIVAQWKVYEKAGQKGWASIVPIYNIVVLTRIVGKPSYWVLLMFIPLVGIIYLIRITHHLSKSFGKGTGFTIGLLFLPFIFFPILGFGDAEYLGNKGIKDEISDIGNH